MAQPIQRNRTVSLLYEHQGSLKTALPGVGVIEKDHCICGSQFDADTGTCRSCGARRPQALVGEKHSKDWRRASSSLSSLEDSAFSQRSSRRQSAVISLDRRAKRATAVTVFMRSMINGLISEGASCPQSPSGQKDESNVRKPVVVEFLEKAITAVIRKNQKREMSLQECQEIMKKKDGRTTFKEDDEFESASEDEKISKSDSDEDEQAPQGDSQYMRKVLQSLQDNLMAGSNVAILAGLLSTSTFSLKDKKIDEIIGASVPFKIREVLMSELSNAIDTLWERFGALLVERYGSFERAFAELDNDGSGFIDRQEFTTAYVKNHLRAMAIERGEDPDAIEYSDESPKTSPRHGKEDAKVRRRMSSVMGQGLFSGSRRSRSGSAGVGGSHRNTLTLLATNVSSGNLAHGVLSVDKLNKVILKADAEFLFDMLRTGERGMARLGQEEEDAADLQVSMQSLVMRLAGLGEKTMEGLRLRVIERFSNLENAFSEYTKGKSNEMTLDEFGHMYNDLISGGSGPDDKKVRISVELAAHTDTCAVAKRIFNGIDLDGSGFVSIYELHRALANFAPPTGFGHLRRRLLLQYGSFELFYVHMRGNGRRTTAEIIEFFTYEHDLNNADGQSFSENFNLVENDDDGDLRRSKHHGLIVPSEGFTVEELAIRLFLNKPEEATIDELIAKLGYADREKDIPFREFVDNVLCSGDTRSRQGGRRLSSVAASERLSDGGRKGAPKAKAAAGGKAALGNVTRPTGRHRTTSLARVSVVLPTSLPLTCKPNEAKMIYEALQREHRRVNVNILARSLTNIAEYIALDKTSYQSGDRIFCRIRLSSDAMKKARELPVVAVVPEKLEWKDNGFKGHWSLNGEKVSDLPLICERVLELPRSSNGSVQKEAYLKIPVPFVHATQERYEVRIFSSTNGREPGKQIGRGVAFDILMPRPQTPLVDQVHLNAAIGEASVVLHWSPPPGKFAASPIMNYILHVEPLIYRHELIAENFGNEEKDLAHDPPSPAASDDDSEDNEVHGLQEITVWSPVHKSFMKKLSYRIDNLQRGVQYRFGVQCVHAGPGALNSAEGRHEIRGAASDLSTIVTMPLYNVTEAPGQPQPSQRADGMVELSWSAPADEGLLDSNRICNYIVQYRHSFASPTAELNEEIEEESSSEDSNDGASSVCTSRVSSRRHSVIEEEEDEKQAEDKEEIDSDEEEGWVAIDDTSIFISQPRWADFYGWQVPCLIHDLEPIDGPLDARAHEFRVCAVNYAGNSAWSKHSSPITLHITQETSQAPQPVASLEVLEVRGSRVLGQIGSNRSQCVLRWIAGFDAKDPVRYSVQVRDAHHSRGESGWMPVDTFILQPRFEASGSRRSSGQMHVQAIVTGLDRFPSFAELAIQVRATNSLGSSTAEVLAHGLELLPPLAPVKAPAVIQGLVAQMGANVVELRWPAAELQDMGSTVRTRYVLQAASAPKPAGAFLRSAPTVIELKWSDFVEIQDVRIVDAPNDPLITCFARGLSVDNFYIFRVGVCKDNGEVVSFSPTSETPFEMTEKLTIQSRRAMFTSNSSEKDERKQQDSKPRKPRDVQVLRSEQGWCELSWEQRVPISGGVPTKYEVQECKEDPTTGPTWELVHATYVTLEDAPCVDGYACYMVKAAVFFACKEPPRLGVVLPRWRVRIRPADCDCDWSSPSHWQNPPSPQVPSQPSAPKIMRNEQHHLVLEWEIPEGGLGTEGGGHYDLQMQTHQERRGHKVSDWRCVPVYTCAIENTNASNRLVRAVIERRAVMDISRGSSGEDLARFRVRIACDGGVTGQPSDASEYVPLQAPLPPVPELPDLEVLGHGRMFMESSSGGIMDGEFVRLQWSLPFEDEESDHVLDAGLSGIHYELEAKNEDHGFWVPFPGASIEIDQKSGTGASFVPLPLPDGHMQQTHFRIAASRRKGGEVVYSPSSAPVLWGGPVELDKAPKVVHALPTVIAIRFMLPHELARAGVCSVSVALEICHRTRHRPQKQSSSIITAEDFTPQAVQVDVEDFETMLDTAEIGDAQEINLPDDEDEKMYEEDDYDEKEDGAGRVFEMAGEFALCWRPVSLGLHEDLDPVSSHTIMHFDVGCECEASLVLDRLSSKVQCVPGDEVRVALRACVAGSELGDLSDFSAPVLVSERAGEKAADLHLEYPRWQSVLPKGLFCTFVPRFFAGALGDVESQEFKWCREALRAKDGSKRLRFEIARGALPTGFHLDPETGRIFGSGSGDGNVGFTVKARVLVTWPGRAGVPVVVGTAASTSLKCSFVDEELREALVDAFQDSVVSGLQEEGVSLPEILRFMATPKILTLNHSLKTVMDGDTGESAFDLLSRLLRWPSDAIVVGAELDEAQLLARLFGEEISNPGSRSGRSVSSDDESSSSEGSSSSKSEQEHGQSNDYDAIVPDRQTIAQKRESMIGDLLKFDDNKPRIQRRHSSISISEIPKGLTRRKSLALLAKDIKLDRVADIATGLGLDTNRPRETRRAVSGDNTPSDGSGADSPIVAGSEQKDWKEKRKTDFERRKSRPVSPERLAQLIPSKDGERKSTVFAKSRSVSPPEVPSQSPPGSCPDIDYQDDNDNLPSIPSGPSRRGSLKRQSAHGTQHRRCSGGRRSTHATSHAARATESEPAGKLAAMLDIELLYPNITPLLSAFTDVEFTPIIKCFAKSKKKCQRTELPPPDAGLLVFSVQPPFPARIEVDETTGIIRGSPLIEHFAGVQYIVTASWEDSLEVAAQCAVAFAVCPVDVASVCNAAYLGRREAPSFRSLQLEPMCNNRGAEQNGATIDETQKQDIPLVSHRERGDSQDYPKALALGAETSTNAFDVTGQMHKLPLQSASYTGAGKFALPVQGESWLGAKIVNKPHLRSLPPNWRSKYGACAPLSLEGVSRTRVFPLGPPLRSRSCVEDQKVASLTKPSSARMAMRPVLPELSEFP